MYIHMFFLHIKSFFAVFWVHECLFNLVYLIVTIIRIIISTRMYMYTFVTYSLCGRFSMLYCSWCLFLHFICVRLR